MNEPSASRHVLYLVVQGFPPERLKELTEDSRSKGAEIFPLTETNAREALEKIFAADSIAVWGAI